MNTLEIMARRIEHKKQDPQEWAEFVTDCMCVVATAFIAAFALVLLSFTK